MKTGAIFEPASTPAPGIIDIGDRRQHFLGRGEVGSYDAGYMMPSGPILESGAHEITWEDADLSRLQGEAVRLRLEIRNACLYSFQFQR